MTQGTKTRALWQLRGVGWGGRWEGGSRGRGHMYTYDWSMLMYGRNHHNIVIILQLEIKKLRKHHILKKWKRNADSIPLRYGDQCGCDIPGAWVGLGPNAAVSWIWGSLRGCARQWASLGWTWTSCCPLHKSMITRSGVGGVLKWNQAYCTQRILNLWDETALKSPLGAKSLVVKFPPPASLFMGCPTYELHHLPQKSVEGPGIRPGDKR